MLHGMVVKQPNWSPLNLRGTPEVSDLQLGWRMAVLPFRNLGASIGYGIALGMAEEVSAALSRFRVPRLIATATFWDGKGPAADAWERCRIFQLDYVVDGTIQVVDNCIRVVVTLLDVVLDPAFATNHTIYFTYFEYLDKTVYNTAVARAVLDEAGGAIRDVKVLIKTSPFAPNDQTLAAGTKTGGRIMPGDNGRASGKGRADNCCAPGGCASAYACSSRSA